MEKIRQVIVVEGQNDINKVQSCVPCDCIKTNGTHLSASLLKHLKELNKTRGIIIMTDDDSPGRMIRSQIFEAVGPCGHVFIDRKVSQTSKKIGIEHASCAVIKEALSKVIMMDEANDTFPYTEYLDLNLVIDHQKRNKLIKKLGLPPMNSKRFFKVQNMMQLTPQDVVL